MQDTKEKGNPAAAESTCEMGQVQQLTMAQAAGEALHKGSILGTSSSASADSLHQLQCGHGEAGSEAPCSGDSDRAVTSRGADILTNGELEEMH